MMERVLTAGFRSHRASRQASMRSERLELQHRRKSPDQKYQQKYFFALRA
jgi:hypothetical protein